MPYGPLSNGDAAALDTAAMVCAKLEHHYGNEHPQYTLEVWQHLVMVGDTRNGYWEWVADQLAEFGENED